MKKSIFLLGFSIFLVGCTNTSGVISIGDDTYMISRSKKGFDVTGSAVKAASIQEANKYCSSQNKIIKIVKTSSRDMVPFKSDAQAEIEFKCIRK